MFGFSLSKLLVLALIIGAVMIGYRLFGRGGANGGNQTVGGRGKGAASGPVEPEAVDTEYDGETGTYVVRDRDAKPD
ncbi:MAG: hypothetical protein ACPGQM_14550 [Alphaproteobacteria bacterium]